MAELLVKLKDNNFSVLRVFGDVTFTGELLHVAVLEADEDCLDDIAALPNVMAVGPNRDFTYNK